MATGRLIRVRIDRRVPAATVYVVAETDAAAAIHILQSKLSTGDEYEDLGRVNDSLIATLGLKRGQFSRLWRRVLARGFTIASYSYGCDRSSAPSPFEVNDGTTYHLPPVKP